MGRAMAQPENLFNNRLNLNRRLVLGAGAFLAASAGRSDRGFAMQKFESGRVMSDGLGIYYEVHGEPLAGRTPMVLRGRPDAHRDRVRAGPALGRGENLALTAGAERSRDFFCPLVGSAVCPSS